MGTLCAHLLLQFYIECGLDIFLRLFLEIRCCGSTVPELSKLMYVEE